MKLPLLSLLVVLTLPSCQGEVGKVCTSQDQCAADECCQIINYIVASRRRQVLEPFEGMNTSGTCQKLKLLGESCSSIAQMNGFCGCAEGLSCTTIHFNAETLGKRLVEFPAVCTKA